MTDDEANAVFDPDADKEPLFDREIRPHMSKVLELCRAHGVPFVALFQVSPSVFRETCSIPVGAGQILFSIEDFIERCRDLGADLN